MKNLILLVAFLGFMISPSFAASTTTSSNIEFCEDGKKCDKKDCKHNKKECKKGDKKCCSKDSKASAKKSCCSGKTDGKKCSKSKAASTTTKTTEKQ
ncbi:MAG: hypothetical protein P1U41_07835 [Vicingaceae bacterium]|nr:hypothetical protein [Vicingaceae bacterium]